MVTALESMAVFRSHSGDQNDWQKLTEFAINAGIGCGVCL